MQGVFRWEDPKPTNKVIERGPGKAAERQVENNKNLNVMRNIQNKLRILVQDRDRLTENYDKAEKAGNWNKVKELGLELDILDSNIDSLERKLSDYASIQ